MQIQNKVNASQAHRPFYIGLDWVELNVTVFDTFHENIWSESDKKKYPFLEHFELKLLEVQDRSYRYVVGIFQDNVQIASIRYMPKSTVLPKESGILKIMNWILYKDFYMDIIQMILSAFNFKFNSISRVDVCYDFTTFMNNYKPDQFIKDFLAEFIKLKSKTFWQSHGKTNSKTFANSLKFGSLQSIVTYQIYNKVLEMKMKTFKPWIENTWIKNGWNKEDTMYRIEFSCKNHNNLFVSKDGEVLYSMKDWSIIKQENHMHYFQLLFNHYWRFCNDSGDSNLSRRPDIKLFDFAPTKLLRHNDIDKKESDRTQKILIHKLQKYIQSLSPNMHETKQKLSNVIMDMVSNSNLELWWLRKQMYGQSYIPVDTIKRTQTTVPTRTELKSMLVGLLDD